MPQLAEEIGKSPNSKSNGNSKESDTTEFPMGRNIADDKILFEFIMFTMFDFVKLY
jgi:hypothetical protein